MNTTSLTTLLQIAAILHLGLIWAGATMPSAVGLRQHLSSLPSFVRRLFYVYFTFIGLILIAFGMLTFVFAREMAAGEPVARGLCIVMGAFWTVRLIAAAFVFEIRPYLKNWLWRVGYHSTNIAFVYLLTVYVIAALRGAWL